MTTRLFLFDDRRARRWAPFTLTRPAGEMLFGCLTFRERAERLFGVPCEGHLTRAALVGFDEPGAAPALPLDGVGSDGVRILLSSRAVPDFGAIEIPTGPATIEVGGRTAGWVLPDGRALPSEAALRAPEDAAVEDGVLSLPGTVVERPWHLVKENPERVAKDIRALWPDDHDVPGCFRIGDGHVSLAEGATIEPGVHLDLRSGPIRLDEGARVEGPARLTGPLYVGPGSTVFGGAVGTSSIGPVCLVRGEVVDSIFLGWDNKAHDGHIGHALVGQWVNLGAFTTNSDLKNNYKPVRIWTLEGERNTGLMKVGCFLGDHVKTGIHTVLNTGTVVGAGSNLFGGVMPPTVVPPFSWGVGPDLRDHRLAKFLETAEAAMARRDRVLTPGVRALLEEAWQATAGRRAE